MWILTFIGLLFAIPIGWLFLAGAMSLGIRILPTLIGILIYTLLGAMTGSLIGSALAVLLMASGAPPSVYNGAVSLGPIGGAVFGVFLVIMEIMENK
ncbi:MAG: hypothetical protein WBV73_27950 [Phormidium sp.]